MYLSTQVSPIQSVLIALFFLILGFFLILLLKSPDRKYLLGLFFSAFLVRVICVYIVYYYLIAVGGDGYAFTDDRNYDAAGSQIASALRAGKDGYDLHSWQQNPGYFYFNGWLYSLIGSDTLSARIVNGFLSSITALFVFEIVRLLFDFRAARIAGLLSAFMPSIVYLSVLQFKDTALIFVMVYTVYLLVAKKDQKLNIRSVFSVICALFVMWYLRKDFTLPYIGIIMLWLILRYTGIENWLERMHKSGLSAFSGIFILMLGGGVLIGLANTGAGHVFFERFDKITVSNKEFVEKANTTQIGFSRYLRINSISDIYKLPFSVGFTTILPLPAWGWLTSAEHAGMALYSVTNLAFIFLLPFVLLGFFLTKGLTFTNTVMLRWFPLLLMIGISVVYMGVLRYKEQLMAFFIIWAAVALSQREKHKLIIGIFYFFGAISVIVATVFASMGR
ncbi:MAG: glycosyltransferase family 39 protein [Methylococcaceae bacterium]|nr:glycosyltransferase family 39 protein [Methylococcaceae bacterium]